MLRKLITFLLAFTLFIVPASAAKLPGKFEIVDGNTYLQTFMVANAKPEILEFWKEWKSSSRNIFVIDTLNNSIGYGFMIIPDGETFTFHCDKEKLSLSLPKGTRMVSFERSKSDTSQLVPTGMATINTSVPRACKYIVFGTYFGDNYSFPSGSYDYHIDDYQGSLVLVDDLGDEPVTPPPGGEDSEGSLIDKILDGIKDLFIPSEGYFDKWFEDIHSAAQKQFGAIFDLYEILKEAANALKSDSGNNDSYIWNIPANKLFPGSPAISADILKTAVPYFSKIKGWFTIIIVITTAIICYRRIVAVFEF